jgi:hypothetical protein
MEAQMPAILLKILGPLVPYLVAGGAVLAGLLYVVILRQDLAAATQANQALAQQNAENVAAIASYQAQQAKWTESLQALDAQTLATNTAASRISEKISLAPPADDGPVAPVLSQALDNLRALQGGAP